MCSLGLESLMKEKVLEFSLKKELFYKKCHVDPAFEVVSWDSAQRLLNARDVCEVNKYLL